MKTDEQIVVPVLRLMLRNQVVLLEGLQWLGLAPGVTLHNDRAVREQMSASRRVLEELDKVVGA